MAGSGLYCFSTDSCSQRTATRVISDTDRRYFLYCDTSLRSPLVTMLSPSLTAGLMPRKMDRVTRSTRLLNIRSLNSNSLKKSNSSRSLSVMRNSQKTTRLMSCLRHLTISLKRILSALR